MFFSVNLIKLKIIWLRTKLESHLFRNEGSRHFGPYVLNESRSQKKCLIEVLLPFMLKKRIMFFFWGLRWPNPTAQSLYCNILFSKPFHFCFSYNCSSCSQPKQKGREWFGLDIVLRFGLLLFPKKCGWVETRKAGIIWWTVTSRYSSLL